MLGCFIVFIESSQDGTGVVIQPVDKPQAELPMLELYIVMNYSMTSLGQPELLIAKVNKMRRNCRNHRNPQDSDTDNRK